MLRVAIVDSEPMSRRDFLRRSALLAAAGALGGCTSSDRVLNFYNWSNYIDADTLPGFEKEFGVKVNYDNFSSQDVLFAKMRIGVFGYDLIVTTDYKVQKYIKLGLLQPLPTERIPNLKNLYERFRHAPFDPGNRYTVPWQWGTSGIGYNKKQVQLASETWSVLWDKRYAGKITMLDEMRDAIGSTLIMLGYDGNSVDPQELKAAGDKIIELRSILKHFSSDTYIDELASSDAWLSQGWSGDVAQAAVDNPDVTYFIPTDGAFMWVDNLCIPRGAPHPDLAIEFMNYILRPDIGAQITNYVCYASPNQASEPLVTEAIRTDANIYPPPEVQKKLSYFKDLGDKEDLWKEVWRRVKIG